MEYKLSAIYPDFLPINKVIRSIAESESQKNP